MSRQTLTLLLHLSFLQSATKRSSTTNTSSSGSSTTSSSLSQREHCSKCVTSKLCSYSECGNAKSGGCRRAPGSQTMRIDGERYTPKASSMPSTPVTSAATNLDCHQCHMRFTNSAPVTPTSTVQSISFSDTSFTVDSTASSVTSMPGTRACGPATTLATSINLEQLNPICVKCSNMELENSKTKIKLDQLRLVMQQRRERREARKMKAAPYGARIIGTTATATATAGTSNTNDSTNNTSVIQTTIDGPPSTNPIVEQVDTLA